jgi:hypothetical protein
MPHDPNDILTLKEVSLIGMKVLYRAHRTTLRYDTGIDGVKTEVRKLALMAVMRPYVGVVAPAKTTIPWTERNFNPFYPKIDKFSVNRFIGCFGTNIRKIICKNQTSLGTTTTSALAALANWIAASFRASSLLATAVAASILITVTKAAKGAFCTMTEGQAAKLFPKPKPAKKAKKKTR